MSKEKYNYFVAAAIIAAKLEQANKVAKALSLTASNARAVALRAGEGAAGFRPLTDFIDRLANITIRSSQYINQIAAKLSKLSADKFRADAAIGHFKSVYKRAEGCDHLHSLDESYERTKQHQLELASAYKKQITRLSDELNELKTELRNAVILTTLSRVEASQAGEVFYEQLNNVADNVENSATLIKEHIISSLKLVASFEQEDK